MKRKGSDTGWLSVQRLLNRGFLVEPSRPQNRISDTLISKAHGTSVSRSFLVVCSRMRLPRVPGAATGCSTMCSGMDGQQFRNCPNGPPLVGRSRSTNG